MRKYILVLILMVFLCPRNARATPIDFKDFEDSDKAESWGDVQYGSLENAMSTEEQRSLSNFLNFNQENSNYTLEDTLSSLGGKLIIPPIDASNLLTTLFDKYEKDIDNLEKVFRRPEAKLNEALIVYKNIDTNFIGLSSASLRKNEAEYNIDPKKAEHFTDLLKYVQYSGYVSVSNFNEKSNSILQLRLELPQGLPTARSYDNQSENFKLILPKNSAFLVKSVSLIKSPIDRLVIHAKYVEEDVVNSIKQKKIRDIEVAFKEVTNKENILSFHLSNTTSSMFLENYSHYLITAMDQFKKRLSAEGLDKMLSFLQENRNGKICIGDIKLFAWPNSDPVSEQEYFEHMNSETGGITNEKDIFLDINVRSNPKQIDFEPTTLIHEFGHLFDHYAGFSIHNKMDNLMSASYTFNQAYTKEKDTSKISDYGKTNAQEYFAEIFYEIITQDSKRINEIKESTPESFAIISQLLKTTLNVVVKE